MIELEESIGCRTLKVGGVAPPSLAASGRHARLEGTNAKIRAVSDPHLDAESKSYQVFNASTRSGPGDAKVAPGQAEASVLIEDLYTELRHKYITILKSLYWEYYEGGQC